MALVTLTSSSTCFSRVAQLLRLLWDRPNSVCQASSESPGGKTLPREQFKYDARILALCVCALCGLYVGSYSPFVLF